MSCGRFWLESGAERVPGFVSGASFHIVSLAEGARIMSWFSEAFGDFQDIQWYTLVISAAAIAAGIFGAVWYARKRKSGDISKLQWSTHELTTAALCIGLSFLLSFIKLFSMPAGGSITAVSMLPILAFAYIYGPRKGILTGLVYSLLQFIQEPFILAPMQVILDYPLAFGALGLAGFARRSIIPGIIYGVGGRFVCSWLSGIVFFSDYAPEGMPGWLYSLEYNGTVMGIECALCIAAAMIPALSRTLERQREIAERVHTSGHATQSNA